MKHKQLSDQQLNSLLKQNESTTIERTESLKNNTEKIKKAICAFSNDLAGTEQTGVIFIDRNPSLAEACKNLGFIERFGFGLPKAKKALKENGNPDLELRAEESFILAITKKSS